MSVRMDWFEGFHVYGEHGSVVAKAFQPWYLRAAEVECFSDADRSYHRPLDADSHFFRRQIEGFADTILTGAPQAGANAEDGLAAIRALTAIERSLDTGEKIELADVAGAV
jgi:predicted dehydrogenase